MRVGPGDQEEAWGGEAHASEGGRQDVKDVYGIFHIHLEGEDTEHSCWKDV